jgi:eukaryotic-like serine/threonine-protein kinase
MPPLIERYWKPIVAYILVPLAVLWIVFLAVDLAVMPLFTRHGAEFPLPLITGLSESEAQQVLQQRHLSLQVAGREYSANKPEGVILSQLPEPGMPVKSGRSVKVVVSAGVRVADVPNVIGLPLDQAILALQRAGFSLGETYYMAADTLPADAVIESIPTRGTPLPLGSKVSLAINRSGGGSTVYMPQLVGMPLDRARALLDGLSLGISDISKIKDTLYLPNTVLDQIPARNAPLMRGDSVKLVISETD